METPRNFGLLPLVQGRDFGPRWRQRKVQCTLTPDLLHANKKCSGTNDIVNFTLSAEHVDPMVIGTSEQLPNLGKLGRIIHQQGRMQLHRGEQTAPINVGEH